MVFAVLHRSVERVAGNYLRGLAPGQHSSEETSQRWRAVGDVVSNLTDPGIKPRFSRTNTDVLPTELTDLTYIFSFQ